MKNTRRFKWITIFSYVLCLGISFLFFQTFTKSVLADPAGSFADTNKNNGFFTSLPDSLKGFFSSENAVLNGFFRYIEQSFGGASIPQGSSREIEYPPYQFPYGTGADFIKVTSSWLAACQKDVPPDELHPAVMSRPTDSQCPWADTTAPGVTCPNPPGEGCCLGNACGCLEVCLNPSGGFTVTNLCSGTLGDVTIFGNPGNFQCGPFNLWAGTSTTVCGGFGVFSSFTVTNAVAGSACHIDDPSNCCPPGALDLCSI